MKKQNHVDQRKDLNVIVDVVCNSLVEKFLHLKHLPNLRAKILKIKMLFYYATFYLFCVFFTTFCSFIAFSIFV